MTLLHMRARNYTHTHTRTHARTHSRMHARTHTPACFEHPPKLRHRYLVVTSLVPHETAAVSAQVLCRKLYNNTPFYSGTAVRTNIDRVDVCLGVTCHLHFWQNDQDRLRATAVTRGWNGYRNKPESAPKIEKKVLPRLKQRLEPGTFQVQHSNH